MSTPDLKWMVGRRFGDISLVEPVCWWFNLRGGGAVATETIWRVVAGGSGRITSSDPGQPFGLEQPVDAAVETAQLLSDATIRRASVTHDTGDVVLEFDNGLRFEVLTTS